MLQLFQKWTSTIVIFLLTSIILSFIFSSFIIFVWLFILCSQGWGNMIFNLTNVFFGRLNCLKHLLSSNVLCFTYFVLCYSLWGQRFQIKGVRLKFKGLRFEIIVLGLTSESLVILLDLKSLCQVKALTKLKYEL